MSNRPHPSELKAGDIVAAPWSSPIRKLRVSRVEKTTLGEALESLNPDVSPDTPAWAVYGVRFFGRESDIADDEPESRLVFSDSVGNPMYQRPILLKSAEQGLEAEL